jgi:uncharacterized membrane protein
MSEPITPQPPFTNVPYTDVPSSGPAAYQPAAGYPPQPGYPPQQPGYPPQQPGYPPAGYAASPGLSQNSAAALSYVTIIPAIIFLILEPYNRMPLVRFHAVQCLALAGVSFVLQVGLTIISLFLHFIPLIGILFSILHLVVFVCIAVAWLIAIIKASKGEWYKLPVIGDFAEKQARS